MKNKILFSLFNLLLIINLCSCSSDDDSSRHAVPENQVAFLLYDLAEDSYSYFYKGEIAPLTSVNGSIVVKDMVVYKEDLYIVGSQKINDIWSIALWKNGVLDTSTPVYPERFYTEAIDIDNDKIFLTGRRVFTDRIEAVLLKDNDYQALGIQNESTFTNDISVFNNVTAIAGRKSRSVSESAAIAWENNALIEFDDYTSINSTANCVLNDGIAPLYGGYRNDNGSFVPTIWDRNGNVASYMLPDNRSGQIEKIYRFENDLYSLISTNKFVDGKALRKIELWKNGIQQEVLIEETDANVRSIFLGEIGGKLYYAAGSNTNFVFRSANEDFEMPNQLTGKLVVGIAN